MGDAVLKAHLKRDRRTAITRAVRRHRRARAPSNHHARLTKKLGIEDYTLKDARHSVGVRMRLAGKSFEEIAEQLGTSVYQAVTVYTR
jgi:hypothetical protein